MEKPKGFFEQTLYLSAKLQPPNATRPKWRLVEGIVQVANQTEGGTNLKEFASFGANEFEESLLSSMPRFQSVGDEDGGDDDEDGAAPEEDSS